MIRRGLLLLLVSVLASGCMTLGLAVKKQSTPASHPIMGGLIGDLVIGAGASRIQGRMGDEEVEPLPYVWFWVGGVVLVDTVAATLIHLNREK